MEKELKITIDQLKNYLGTGLEIFPEGKTSAENTVFIGFYQDPCLSVDCVYFGTINGQDMRTVQEMKPICYRLSDLDKHIPELGFVPLVKMVQECHLGDPSEDWFCGEAIRSRSTRKVYNVGYRDIRWEVELGYPPALRFDYYQKLFQWYFWPFGDEYFEAGLVIDKLANK